MDRDCVCETRSDVKECVIFSALVNTKRFLMLECCIHRPAQKLQRNKF